MQVRPFTANGLEAGTSNTLTHVHTQSSAAMMTESSSAPSVPIPQTPPRQQRARLRSLPLGRTDDLADLVRRSLHLGTSSTDGSEKTEPKHVGFRGLLRRASTSIRGRKPRAASHSHPNAPAFEYAARPSTSSSAWHKLRQAASFRNSKTTLNDYDEESGDDMGSGTALVPGSGSAPPIIPRGFGGAAARATAAAQNEMLERTRTLMLSERGIDSESAVELTYLSQAQIQDEDPSITRLDFVTRLPSELAIHVLQYLDNQALCQAAFVSRAWHTIASTNQIWRESFYREKSGTYAMGGPILPGEGLGLPPVVPEKSWKEVYRVKQQLETNWKNGNCKPIYLNGHLDSIYCVQFDE
jgi:F-box and WD-40 domain protein 1/11